jgi:hypothetical protein
VQEPKRDEDAAELRAAELQVSEPQELAAEPRAYAFDGWAMVPLEFDPA